MSGFNLSLPDSVPDDRYRRRVGLLLGAALGFAFGLVAQFGDRLYLPGIALHQPPLGPFGNTALFALAGALLGLLVAWPRSGLQGVFLMAAAGAAGIVLYSLAAATALIEGFAIRVVAAVFLALPFWGLFVPIFAAVRWVTGHQEEAHRDGQSWRGRVLGPLALIALAALVGYTAIYPPRGREVLQTANAMLAGAARTGQTPEALANVAGFAAHARSPYRLSWETSDLEKYRIPRPARNFDFHSAAIARYQDGWNLVCIYIAADEAPLCQGFDALPE